MLILEFSSVCLQIEEKNCCNAVAFPEPLFYLFVVFNLLLKFLNQKFVVFFGVAAWIFFGLFSTTVVSVPNGDDSLVVTTHTKKATIMPLNGRPPEEENRLCVNHFKLCDKHAATAVKALLGISHKHKSSNILILNQMLKKQCREPVGIYR